MLTFLKKLIAPLLFLAIPTLVLAAGTTTQPWFTTDGQNIQPFQIRGVEPNIQLPQLATTTITQFDPNNLIPYIQTGTGRLLTDFDSPSYDPALQSFTCNPQGFISPSGVASCENIGNVDVSSPENTQVPYYTNTTWNQTLGDNAYDPYYWLNPLALIPGQYLGHYQLNGYFGSSTDASTPNVFGAFADISGFTSGNDSKNMFGNLTISVANSSSSYPTINQIQAITIRGKTNEADFSGNIIAGATTTPPLGNAILNSAITASSSEYNTGADPSDINAIRLYNPQSPTNSYINTFNAGQLLFSENADRDENIENTAYPAWLEYFGGADGFDSFTIQDAPAFGAFSTVFNITGGGAVTTANNTLDSGGTSGNINIKGIATIQNIINDTSAGTSTFSGGIKTGLLQVTSTIASSTFGNGINVNTGCFSIKGVCVGSAGGGSGTVNSGTVGQDAFYASTGTAVSGTSTVFISNSSQVGIGTSTPFAQISIAPPQQSNAPLFDISSTTGADLIQVNDAGHFMVGTTSDKGFNGTTTTSASFVGTTTIINGELTFGNKFPGSTSVNPTNNIIIVNSNDPVGINRNTVNTLNNKFGDTIMQGGESYSTFCGGAKVDCFGYGNSATSSNIVNGVLFGNGNAITYSSLFTSTSRNNEVLVGNNNIASTSPSESFFGNNNNDGNDISGAGGSSVLGNGNITAGGDNILGNNNVSDFEKDGLGGNNFILGSANQVYLNDFDVGSNNIDEGTLGNNISLGNLNETNGFKNAFYGNFISNIGLSGNAVTSGQLIMANNVGGEGQGDSIDDTVNNDTVIANNGVGYLYVNYNGFMGLGGTTTPSALVAIATSSPQAGLTLFEVASSTKANLFSIDGAGHRTTGGSAPTCGTGCASVKGDDNTMRVVTNSAVTSITVNFSTKYAESPVCIPTEEDGGLSGAVDASTTPSTVVLTTSAAVTSINIGVMCQQSNNFTY